MSDPAIVNRFQIDAGNYKINRSGPKVSVSQVTSDKQEKVVFSYDVAPDQDQSLVLDIKNPGSTNIEVGNIGVKGADCQVTVNGTKKDGDSITLSRAPNLPQEMAPVSLKVEDPGGDNNTVNINNPFGDAISVTGRGNKDTVNVKGKNAYVYEFGGKNNNVTVKGDFSKLLLSGVKDSTVNLKVPQEGLIVIDEYSSTYNKYNLVCGDQGQDFTSSEERLYSRYTLDQDGFNSISK